MDIALHQIKQLQLMKRRSFINNSVLGTIGASIIGTNFRSIENSISNGTTKYFMSESGIYGKENNFLLGILQVDRADINEAELINLRSTTNFKNVFTYRSNDRYKIPFVKTTIDLFSSSIDYKLHIIHSDISGEVDNIENKLSVINEYKIDVVNRLIENFGNAVPSTVYTKYQSLNGPSESFRVKFNDRTNVAHETIITRESNLLQLSSYLTSSVAAIINDKIHHPVKSELTTYLMNSIGGLTFDNSFTTDKIHFLK